MKGFRGWAAEAYDRPGQGEGSGSGMGLGLAKSVFRFDRLFNIFKPNRTENRKILKILTEPNRSYRLTEPKNRN